MLDIGANLKNLKAKLRQLEQKYQRPPNSVQLLVVTKGHSLETIAALGQAQQWHIAENYAQETLAKLTALNDNRYCWHYIGSLHSNKAAQIAPKVNWVHSINRFKIAQRLNHYRPPQLAPLNICLQVNAAALQAKQGLPLAAVAPLLEKISKLNNLKVRGLMSIADPLPTFAAQRAYFHAVATLFTQLNQQGYDLDTLSMGMSNDYEAAIAEGATLVRIGTAILGPRNFHPIPTN
jgi:pyridoxal phosphate enzyme (YggS family)